MGHWIKVLIALVYRPIEDEYQIQIICSFNFISPGEIVFDYSTVVHLPLIPPLRADSAAYVIVGSGPRD
jgi:hypothetical protein